MGVRLYLHYFGNISHFWRDDLPLVNWMNLKARVQGGFGWFVGLGFLQYYKVF